MIGVLLMAIFFALTLGSSGQYGRSFFSDLAQAEPANLGSAVLGGMIWAVGMTFSIIAFGIASPAISYGLGQGATMVAALWGVFIWREFRGAPRGTGLLIALMFAGYFLGLALIILAGS